MTSYDIHLLFLPAKQALNNHRIKCSFCNILGHNLTYFIFRSNMHFFKSKVSSQTNKFKNLLLTSFILKHSKYFTIKSCLNSRCVISLVVTSVKPFLNVEVDIVVKPLFLISYARESVSVKRDCALPLF